MKKYSFLHAGQRVRLNVKTITGLSGKGTVIDHEAGPEIATSTVIITLDSHEKSPVKALRHELSVLRDQRPLAK